MFESLPEIKVMRDPIHEYIHVDKKVIWECINSPEFQRLRRIHQLGPAMYVYHSAEHSRFSHCLGVYEITRRMIDEVIQQENLSEFDRISVMCAALLHDLGHGPFSHSFEQLTNIKHEDFSVSLLQSDSTVHDILKQAHPDLPQSVIDIIKHSHKNPLLSQLISGQLDADRMDYLLRDAYFSGTSYGKFDLERMFRTMRVVEDKLVIKLSGVHTVEDYIMARYHMYWQVYYHPVSRSVEAILHGFFKRLTFLYNQDSKSIQGLELFIPFLNKQPISNKDFLALDEPSFLHLLKVAMNHPDEILSDFAERVINRRLFEYVDVEDEAHVDSIKKRLQDLGYDLNYYLYFATSSKTPYYPYALKEESMIWVVDEKMRLFELSEASTIVKAITLGKEKEENKMFFPKECL
jgi:HD superfamily phosphohydrolase